MGQRKTNIKKKIKARHEKAMMMRMKYETEQAILKSINHVVDALFDEVAKQDSYRWN
jgi:hypothetical protein